MDVGGGAQPGAEVLPLTPRCFSFLGVELEISVVTALCSASYIDDASQQMTIGAATSSWDVLKSILSDVVTKIKTYAFGRTLRMPLYFPPLKSGGWTNVFLFVCLSMIFLTKVDQHWWPS